MKYSLEDAHSEGNKKDAIKDILMANFSIHKSGTAIHGSTGGSNCCHVYSINRFNFVIPSEIISRLLIINYGNKEDLHIQKIKVFFFLYFYN